MILSEVTAGRASGFVNTAASVQGDPVAQSELADRTHVQDDRTDAAWFTFSFREAQEFPPAERPKAIRPSGSRN